MHSLLTNFSRLFISVFSCLTIVACSSHDLDDLGSGEKGKTTPDDAYTGAVTIKTIGEPEITWFDSKTNVVLQFVTRGENGIPLTPEQVNIQLLVDDKNIGPESQINSSTETLGFDLDYHLVLDASRSMLENEAFEPMLIAAKNSVTFGQDVWNEKAGNFDFQLTWFNDFIFHAENTDSHKWQPEDIESIPGPTGDGFTRLYAATDFALDAIETRKAEKNSNNPRDQTILLIFSDGEDNFSHKDDADLELEESFTDSNAKYVKNGWASKDVDDVITRVQSQSNVTVHVIGLGPDLDDEDLQRIATAGGGSYLKQPETTEVNQLFEEITKEFTSLHTQGAKLPLAEGEYKFTVRVENSNGSESADYSFYFRTGDENASVIDAPTE